MKTSFPTLLPEKWLPNILVITTLALHLFNLIYLPYLNHDAAQAISEAQRLVNGASPYTGFIDTNPPVIFYISALPVILSNVTKISLPVVSLLFFFSLMLFSGYVFIKALTVESGGILSHIEKSFLWTFWLFLSFWTYRVENFAQRDQLIFIFLAGYIVLRKARHDAKEIPLSLAIVCGLLAGIAISLKPQFFLAFILIELILFVFSTNRRNAYLVPEVIALILYGIAFLAHFFMIPGASIFFSYWIPVISRGYAAYNADWETMFTTLFSDPFAFINLGIIALAFVLLLRKSTQRHIVLFFAFTAFGLLSLLMYFVLFKGWFYHTLGFHYGCLTALVLLARDYKNLFSKFRNLSFVILIAFNLVGSGATLYNPDLTIKQPFQFPETATAKVIRKFVPPDQRALFLSMITPSAFPQLTYTGRMGAGRFQTTWPIAFFTNRSPQGDVLPEWEKDDKLYFSWLLQDIVQEKPRLIFVDISIQGHTYSYLLKKGFFQLIPDYKCIGRADYLIVYLQQNESEATNLLTRNTILNLYEQRSLVTAPECSQDNSAPSY